MKYKQYKDQIDHFLKENTDRMLRDLAALIAFKSESANPAEVKKALLWCVEKGAEMRFSAEAVLDGQIGVIEMGKGEKTLGILAHVDVVPAPLSEGWTRPPHELTVAGEMLFGRGVVDDKGPVIAAMYAMAAVLQLGKPFRHKVRLLLGTQEETEWDDMENYCRHYPAPDYGFTPDGEFPIGNRENGYADVLLAFPKKEWHSERNVFEIVDLRSGSSANSVPETARCRLKGPTGDYIEIKTQGKAVHSSAPASGENPIWAMVNFLSALPLARNGAEKLIAFLKETAIGDYHGKAFGLDQEDYEINGEGTNPTAAAVTLLSAESSEFRLNYNIRPGHHLSKEDVAKGFSAYEKKYGFSYKVQGWQPPLYVDRRQPFLEIMGKIYQENATGGECFTAATGTSYAKALPNIVSFGPIFPGEEDTCHEADERLKLSSLILMTKIYAYYIAEMALYEEGEE